MSRINALVLTGYGLNCDLETAHALELAGARARRVHINELIEGATKLDEFQIMAFIGGFSWGDDHGAGVIQAVRMKNNIGEKLLSFVEQGRLVIGICNGFQCLANIGLLPGLDGDYRRRSVALTYNDSGNFRNDWVHLKVDSNSNCIFTRGLDQFELPVRHGEGKFIAEPEILEKLVKNHQIVLKYGMPDGTLANGVFPFNPNGSIADIAGICDTSGRVFGLMPHPEAFNDWTNHPDWPRQHERIKRGSCKRWGDMTPGIKIFKNAIDYFK